jgi:hypothetical protein
MARAFSFAFSSAAPAAAAPAPALDIEKASRVPGISYTNAHLQQLYKGIVMGSLATVTWGVSECPRVRPRARARSGGGARAGVGVGECVFWQGCS